MPPDSLSIVVATGLGISVVAGIVSGVCYVITHGFQRNRYRKPQTPWHCTICGDRFRSIDGILEVDKVCTCSKCRIRICKLKCSLRNQEKKWLCRYCQESESWFKGILNILQPNSKREWYMQSKMEADALSELDEDLLELKKKEKQQVRDFIERLVGAMLGGDLDDVIITKLYDDPNYERLYARYHTDLSTSLTDLGSALHISITNLPITGESPCTVHASLKHLIQKFIQEASELPPLKVRQQQTNDNEYNRTYEDLLSTAIINKVIQNYQGSVASSSRSSPSLNKLVEDVNGSNNNLPEAKEYFFSKETLDTKWKNSDGMDDSTSLSSLEDCIKSESSVSIKYYDDVSLTIQQSIEEVSTSSSDGENEEQKCRGLLKAEDSDWHDNWHLQKRQFNGCHSPVPVPMLVPNPTIETKVLIGDRDAEDTTDLSDAASDYGDIETVPTVNSILIENKTIIGGKNALNNITTPEDTLVTAENLPESNISKEENADDISEDKPQNGTFLEVPAHDVSSEEKLEDEISEDGSTDTRELIEEKAEVFSKFLQSNLETKNDVLIKNNLEDSLNSLDSNIEQNLEHTERYATLPKQIEKIQEPIPKPRSQKISNTDNEPTDKEHNTSNENYDELIKGSYSTREKEKWKNAIQMENNPYAIENLERRLSSRSNSSSSSLYGRDYYIKQAGKAAGASERFANKLKGEETRQPENEPKSIEDDDIIVPSKIERIKPIDDLQIFRAIPVLIECSQSDVELSSIEPQTPTRPNHLDISSDSDMSIERTYNLKTGTITQKFGDIHREVLTGAKSPEGTKYSPIRTELDEKIDENHNDTIVTTNVPFIRSESTKALDRNNNGEDEIDSFSLEYSDYNTNPHNSLDKKYYNSIHSLPYKQDDVKESEGNDNLRESKSLNDIDKDEEEELPSVRELKQIFEKRDNKEKQPPIYSLTARSIPNLLKKELKDEPKSNVEQRATKAEGVQEEVALPSVKNRKAFFESLK